MSLHFEVNLNCNDIISFWHFISFKKLFRKYMAFDI